MFKHSVYEATRYSTYMFMGKKNGALCKGCGRYLALMRRGVVRKRDTKHVDKEQAALWTEVHYKLP